MLVQLWTKSSENLRELAATGVLGCVCPDLLLTSGKVACLPEKLRADKGATEGEEDYKVVFAESITPSNDL